MANLATHDISFEKRRYGLTKMLSDRLGATAINSLQYEESMNIDLMGIAQHLSMEVLSRKLAEDKYTSTQYHPATWWDMFKRDVAPEWFQRRHPVKNKPHKRTVKFTRYANYPLADIAIPESTKITIPWLSSPVVRDEIQEYGNGV